MRKLIETNVVELYFITNLDDNRDRYGRDRRNWGGQSSSDRRWRQQSSTSQWHNRGSFCKSRDNDRFYKAVRKTTFDINEYVFFAGVNSGSGGRSRDKWHGSSSGGSSSSNWGNRRYDYPNHRDRRHDDRRGGSRSDRDYKDNRDKRGGDKHGGGGGGGGSKRDKDNHSSSRSVSVKSIEIFI